MLTAAQSNHHPQATDREAELPALAYAVINRFQHEFPLDPHPFAVIADELGVSEEEVLAVVSYLDQRKALSRIGPVFRTGRVGASTLAAMQVPREHLESVAAIVNEFPEVNHNYEREDMFNLWFVAVAPDRQRLDAVLDEIESRAGIKIIRLPMLESYHIDLGFCI